MTDQDQTRFETLLKRFCAAAEAGDGMAFAACFTADGIYHDYIYGDHRGRDAIAHMLEGLFHRDATQYRWTMFDPICRGEIGYAWSLSTFVSTVPDFAGKRVVIDGMSRFLLKDGLIADYRESVNGGIPHVQLGLAPERMARIMRRWSDALQSRPEVESYLGTHKDG